MICTSLFFRSVRTSRRCSPKGNVDVVASAQVNSSEGCSMARSLARASTPSANAGRKRGLAAFYEKQVTLRPCGDGAPTCSVDTTTLRVRTRVVPPSSRAVPSFHE